MSGPPRTTGVAALRNALSPEQRWTAGVALLLTVALLLFGHPSVPVVVRRNVARPVAAGPAAPPTSVADAPTGPLAGRSSLPPPVPPSAGGVAPAAASPLPAGDADHARPARAVPSMRILALVVKDGQPGRDDEAAARTFLASSTLDADVVVADPADPALCERVGAAADVVVAGLGLDDGLRHCLAGLGTTVLAFDGRGPLTSHSGGGVVSTRRGLVDALSDAVERGVASGPLQGTVGVVAAASVRRDIEATLPSWRTAGLRVVAATYVPDDGTTPVTDEVRRFVAADVDVVLFAVPSQIAGRWAVHHSLLDRTVRYVIGDAFDAVWNEAYPPVLDGAVTYTSLRLPWFAREHGETDTQTTCRQRWEEQPLVRTLLPGRETAMVYAWCQHVALLEAIGASDHAADALRALVRSSPLTSDLGPLGPGRWGPREDAVVAWHSSCVCWRSTIGFTERPR